MTAPLEGLTVLVPRARPQAGALSQRIRALGGEAIEAPTIAIESGDRAGLERAAAALSSGGYAAVCVTSTNGVAALAEFARPDALDRVLVAAVGPGTAAAVREHFRRDPDLVPDAATTAALGAAFPPPARGDRVLLPRADLATPELPAALRAKGWDVDDVVAYRTVAPAGLPDDVLTALHDGRVGVVVFTSSSTVENFVTLTRNVRWPARVVSIGPVTSATCRRHGITVTVEASRHDLDGVVAALVSLADR